MKELLERLSQLKKLEMLFIPYHSFDLKSYWLFIDNYVLMYSGDLCMFFLTIGYGL